MPLFRWSDEPDLLRSGAAEEDSAAYAVWEAMTNPVRLVEDEPEEDAPS